MNNGWFRRAALLKNVRAKLQGDRFPAAMVCRPRSEKGESDQFIADVRPAAKIPELDQVAVFLQIRPASRWVVSEDSLPESPLFLTFRKPPPGATGDLIAGF
ncbi:MAG: hypothetical protein NTW21_31435 [Verrucomicrobia bacterium]|nr:hypothetical protein [Verrucomicrobiota bacterium]